MKELESKLAYYKMIVNSSYGGSQLTTHVYTDAVNQARQHFALRTKIGTIKKRKEKIKRLFNGV
jgi:hypothetical protein